MNPTTEKDRIRMVMEQEGLSSALFAKEIGISAATLSNILSERNKPSLDVLQKIINRYRLISSDWLFLGIGTMYRQRLDAQEQVLLEVKPELPEEEMADTDDSVITIPQEPFARKRKNAQQPEKIVEHLIEKKIKKIVVFYDDGTFQELDA